LPRVEMLADCCEGDPDRGKNRETCAMPGS
jgi:hypothetical protein